MMILSFVFSAVYEQQRERLAAVVEGGSWCARTVRTTPCIVTAVVLYHPLYS